MPVSETRLAVRLQDNASGGLQHLNSQYSRFANTIQNSGNKLAQFNRQVAGVNNLAANVNSAASSLSNMNRMMERLVYSASRYFVIYKAMAAVGDIWDVVVGDSYEYAKSLESNQIGIAGILKSMIKLNGENVKWNDAMSISRKAMKGLQSEALRTAATSQELIETFRAILGPGLASGMSIDQIVNLSTVGTNAVRSLGLPTNQYVQELRSIITEGIRPASSTLATSLGITNKDVKAAKQSAEGLYSFLMKRMEGFSDAVKYTAGTVEGRLARIKEGINVGVATASDELYVSYSNVLEKIADALIPVPKELGQKWEINPKFIEGIREVSNTIGKLTKSIGDIGSMFAPLVSGGFGAGFTVIDQLSDKLGMIAKLFVAIKLTPFIRDVVNLAARSREAYEAETMFGKALQGVSDKLHGRTTAMQRMAEEQQKALEIEHAYSVELSKVNALFAQQRTADRSATKQSMVSWVRNPATESWRADNLVSLMTKLRELGAEEEKVQRIAKQYFEYVKKGSREASDSLMEQILVEEKLYQATKKKIDAEKSWGDRAKESSEIVGGYISTIGGLSMSFGVLLDVLAQADEENKEWYESAGEAAMTAGIFASAIGSIVSAIGSMLPAIAEGIKALREFANARNLAMLGAVGGIAAGVGAIVYKKYSDFKETGIATSRDEFTGEDISLDYNNLRDIDDADSYAIVNDPNYNYSTPKQESISLKSPSLGGAGKGGAGGGKGSGSKVDKAEQSAAKMEQFVAELNKEIAALDNKATAYDKTMSTANAKIAAQEKEIVKAQQLGVDVGEVRNRQLEYSLAMEQKATESLQDEYLKFMKLDEDAANRIYTMGGTMEEQREVLAQRLENHKAYLEELLSAEIENKERRANLEAELANTIKQIHENSAYDMKQGWMLGLQEIANQQVNFKDMTTSLFGSLESGLTTLVSGTESAKEKLKTFWNDLTNTILKSMTQIIIKGLIARAVMSFFGGGGTFIDSTGTGQTLASVPAVIKPPGMARGGMVNAGGTYLVGENGPELLQMGSTSGRIYNNRQTQNALGGGVNNVKIELKNESGTQLKTENASVNFDLDTMVITAVIKGINNNTMGVRSMLKGAVRA